MLTALCTGTLVADPRARTTAGGKPYCTALMRVPCDQSEPVMVSVICFEASAVQAILALAKGDSIAVLGRASLSSWQKDGAEHHGLNIVVERTLTPYELTQRRKQSRAHEEVSP